MNGTDIDLALAIWLMAVPVVLLFAIMRMHLRMRRVEKETCHG